MGKWTPEAREAHKAKMQAVWAAKRVRAGPPPREERSVVVRPVVKTVRDQERAELTVIDAKLEALRADVATLERAKVLLEEVL